MIHAIMLLAFLWLGCWSVLEGYAQELCLFDKAERQRATKKAMKFAWFITVVVALLWLFDTLHPSGAALGSWPEP